MQALGYTQNHLHSIIFVPARFSGLLHWCFDGQIVNAASFARRPRPLQSQASSTSVYHRGPTPAMIHLPQQRRSQCKLRVLVGSNVLLAPRFLPIMSLPVNLHKALPICSSMQARSISRARKSPGDQDIACSSTLTTAT